MAKQQISLTGETVNAWDVNVIHDGVYSTDEYGNLLTFVFKDYETGFLYERGVNSRVAMIPTAVFTDLDLLHFSR